MACISAGASDKVTDLIYLVFSSFWWGMLSGVYSCVIQKSSYFGPTPKCPATCPFPRPSCLQSSRPFSFSPQTSQLDHWPLLRNVYIVSYVLLSFHNHLQLCSLGRFPPLSLVSHCLSRLSLNVTVMQLLSISVFHPPTKLTHQQTKLGHHFH